MGHDADLDGARSARWSLVFAILAGVTAGALLLRLPLLNLLVVVAGALLLLGVNRRPEYLILTIVVLISSIIFDNSLPYVAIGIGSLQVSDLLLLTLVGVIAWRLLAAGSTFATTTLDGPLLLFLVAVTVAAGSARFRYGLDYNHVMRLVRVFSYYLLFFAVTNLISGKTQVMTLVRGLFLIAAAVATVMLVQAAIGEGVQLMPGRIEAARTFGAEYEATRILPPGQTLLVVLTITAIALVTVGTRKPVFASVYFYASLLLGAGVVLTYNRNYWVALILVTGLLLTLLPGNLRPRLCSLLLAIVLFAGLAMAIGSSHGRFKEAAAAVSERFSSLFAGSELTRSSSLEYRYTENRYALQQIARHPLLGIGLGNDYRPEIFGREDTLTSYIHNGYLWLLTDLGLFGFLAFLWFFGRFIVRGLRHWRSVGDDTLRAVTLGFTLSGIGILLMAMVNPMFMQWYSIVVMAVMTGLTEVILRDERSGSAVASGRG